MIRILGDVFDDVYPVVNSWKPLKKYSREISYRDELYEIIRKKLKEPKLYGFGPPETHKVQRESGRGLADIGVDNIVGIELKRNLDSKAKANRLVGQISDYKEEYDYIIVVLVGNTKKEWADYLRHKFRGYSERRMIGREPVIRVLVK